MSCLAGNNVDLVKRNCVRQSVRLTRISCWR